MVIQEINKLKDLDFNKQSVFAYLTCERLYPNYVFFSENYKFGHPNELREAIDYLYNNLFTVSLNETKIQSFIVRVNKLIPEPANFDTILASSALDACGVVYEALNFLIDKQVSRLDYISTMATDTVDMYIQEELNLDFNNDKNFQQKIDEHPFMIKEISIQKGIISYLSKITTITLSDVVILIQLQESKGSLNLS